MDMMRMGKIVERTARLKAALLEHAYLVTLGALVAMVLACGMYTSRVEQAHALQVEAAAAAPEIAETPGYTAMPARTVTPLPTLAPIVPRQAVLVGGARVWPVSGDVIRGYSPQEPVLWAALSCMQPHAAADIAGAEGETVRCVMDGVVERVWQDALWGWQVRIAQTDGSMAAYAGLAVCNLAAGQSVSRGQALGTLLAAVPAEAEMGAHLHVSIERDGETEDPMELLYGAKRQP